ncbi:hypothetical protein HNY73_007302 [Argiope bruennichi]|uniref:Uncharacterized protein n=1 Tax=Argiope bruennichi TaxID=94029 RepID=A0A8T0FEH7_ARGBR|nr:hypothetical protein HNY73_007302 [Argiope bruennichi]
MSSDDKIPLLKKNTSSESSESQSDSEVDKAEENLEHLKLQERLVKEDCSIESRSSDSSIQERNTESTDVPKTVPIEESRLPSADVKSDPAPKTVRAFDLQKEKTVEAQRVGENTETTESTAPFIQSPRKSESPDMSGAPLIPPRKRDITHKLLLSEGSPSNSSASDRQNTLSGIASIVSEVASYSGEEIPYDESANFQEGQPSNDAPGSERLLSEASDSNISDIPDEYQEPPPLTPTDSTSYREYGDQPTVALFQGEEDDMRVCTSLGIVSSKESELEYLHTTSELSEAHLFSREQDIDKMTRCEREPKGNEQELRELEEMQTAAIGLQTEEERIKLSDFGASSPSDRRCPSKYEAGKSSGEKLHCTELSEMKGSNVSPKLQTDKKAGSKEEEPTFKKEVLQRKAKKCKRPDAKLTNSPPSDEIQGSSTKKARPDLELKRTRRTRHDRNITEGSVGPDCLHESDSSPSDGSPDEEETSL